MKKLVHSLLIFSTLAYTTVFAQAAPLDAQSQQLMHDFLQLNQSGNLSNPTELNNFIKKYNFDCSNNIDLAESPDIASHQKDLECIVYNTSLTTQPPSSIPLLVLGLSNHKLVVFSSPTTEVPPLADWECSVVNTNTPICVNHLLPKEQQESWIKYWQQLFMEPQWYLRNNEGES